MRHRQHPIAAGLLGLCACAQAQAADDLLDILQAKGVLSAEEAGALKAQQQARSGASTDSGFKLVSGDGASSLQLGTLQQLDYAAFKQDQADLADGSQLRRSRLSIGGNFLKDWQYRVEYEFSNLTASSSGVTDAYVAYAGYKPLTITIGNVKPPIGLEALASDKTLTFMERGLPFAFINTGNTRAPGLLLSHAGRNWSASAGAFGEPLNTAQTAAGDEGYSLAGRVTYAPLLSERSSVHLGLSGVWRATTQNTGSNGKGSSISFSSKPESNQPAQSFVSTGSIAGNVQHYRVADAEFAAQYGAASLQGEYLQTEVARDTGKNLSFKGWYGQLAYTLSGEMRPYKADRGLFDGIKPARNFGAKGRGAFELAARYSGIDLSDRGLYGGYEQNAALALNWYLNSYLRGSLNAVKVLKLDGGSMDGDKPTLYQMRLQLAF
ncbi:phosphate-selective porin OprO and OprP [Solimonas aquatica]|uniref:Phosphate-selective porin OprO and OprP n=1 Tax=Solimonas aquatica TaxID=489703 RepID=A0A1H9H9I1_9GAMM|nr:porin [Solimonas aquatica]SEQ59004.1 phosphate-selective porin OprO and OprP [Solimonas aquatica]